MESTKNPSDGYSRPVKVNPSPASERIASMTVVPFATSAVWCAAPTATVILVRPDVDVATAEGGVLVEDGEDVAAGAAGCSCAGRTTTCDACGNLNATKPSTRTARSE